MYDKLTPFGPAKLQAFVALIEVFINPPMLHLPSFSLPYSVETNFINYQVGDVLFYTDEKGNLRTIGFRSRSLKDHKKAFHSRK